MAKDVKVSLPQPQGAILERLLLNSNLFEVEMISSIFKETYITQRTCLGLEVEYVFVIFWNIILP